MSILTQVSDRRAAQLETVATQLASDIERTLRAAGITADVVPTAEVTGGVAVLIERMLAYPCYRKYLAEDMARVLLTTQTRWAVEWNAVSRRPQFYVYNHDCEYIVLD